MGTTILSFEDRVVIETLHHEKHSLQYIADYLGFSKTTIFNEVHRLAGEYHAVKAQTDHEVKLSHRGRKTILTTNLKRLIEEKIKIQKWSIEQVAHVVRIAYKTIYNWIDQGLLDINVTDLPNHGIRRKRAKETRGSFSHGRSIEDRPAEISDRNTSGHFEADTVLSGKRKGQAVATFVERKSRLTIVKRLNGRDSTSMTKAILELANQLGDNLKTLTVDHGKEFANYNLIEEQTGVPRRFIPKGQPIDEITDDELIQINWYLNSRPLKCLNWRTPIEIFLRDLRY
ncbi:IS30 family transposase [Limosilactobacillus fermentum]